jgi:NTE family protein
LIVLILFLPTAIAGERPKIGLALGGGGARGGAHLGVLKRLEELRIPVDYIVGTSMGAVVGGLYATGMSTGQIEQAMKDIDWTAIFDDKPPREERRYRRKQDDRTFLIDRRPGVIEKERRVELVPALIQGQTLELALRRYTLAASEVQDFDRLAIPFRAVATDVVTGEVVVLGEGDLAAAIRASMAVPAVFAPVEIGDRLLVDGGLAMNLPVSAVRAMGADIVIAVDVGGPRRTREEIGNIFQMLDQVASLVTARNTEEEIAKLKPRDVLIVPPLEREVLSSQFDRLLEAAAIGEQGADAKRAELARLGVSPAQYAAHQAARGEADFALPVIDFVEIENDSRLDDALITGRISLRPGDRLDPDVLDRDIATVVDQDNFESVRYRVIERDGKTGVVITARQKSWGTSSLQGGLELSSSGGGDSMFNIGAAYTMAPVNRLNAEWRTILRLGEEPGLTTGLYQPLDAAERWYLDVGVGVTSNNLRILGSDSGDTPVAEYQVVRWGGLLEGGRNLGNWGRLGLRYSRYAGDADVQVGGPDFPSYTFDVGELQLGLSVDTLDSLNFPRSGWFGSAYGVIARDWLGSSNDYELAGLSLLRAGTWGRDSLLGGLSLGGNIGGSTPPESFFRMGGFLNLSGFNQRDLSGPYAALARTIYLRDLGTSLVRTYAGGSFEIGNVWQERDDIGFDDLRYGGSLFLGADTILGPVYVGYGIGDGGNDAFYLFLGRPWLAGLREW